MSYRIVLSPNPDSVARARGWAVTAMNNVELGFLADTVALLVSELVTNVVLHARTDCDLEVWVSGGRVRVEVSDGSDQLPAVTIVNDPLAQSGRGMVLVNALSAAHGAEEIEWGGKRVWFELDIPLGSPPPPVCGRR